MNRRKFLGACAATAALAQSQPASAACALRLRFGVAQFDKYDPLLNIQQLAQWGFDYCEPKVMPLSDADFQMRVDLARAAPINVEAMNSLMPANLKVVGPEVDISNVRDYVQKALARHLADASRGRMFPRLDSKQPVYEAFFSAIREIGYRGHMSLEAYTTDFQVDAPAGLKAARKLFETACAR